MPLLLDTHAFLWFCEDDPQLSQTASAAIQSMENTVFVSAASLWEIAIKTSLGKLTLKRPFASLPNTHMPALDSLVRKFQSRHVEPSGPGL